MAFLDRIVSDLIKKSTGINARTFVRAVGGGNMVLLGGAAIAGALAVDKMRQPETHSTPDVPPGPAAAPPLPPLPQTANSAASQQLPPLPPPILAPPELVYAIVRTMVAAALADGEMHAAEKRVIEKRLAEKRLGEDRPEESELSTEQVAQIRKDLVIPAAPVELAALAVDADDRETLYRFAALVVLADDDVADTEKAWLARLAAALGIDAARSRAIDEDLFEST